jgi:hypothetical protein
MLNDLCLHEWPDNSGVIYPLTSFYNLTSTYNSSTGAILSLMNGNQDAVAIKENINSVKFADADSDGFISIKLVYDCENYTMTAYSMVKGEWVELGVRGINSDEVKGMCMTIYGYRTGTICFSVKDVVISQIK